MSIPGFDRAQAAYDAMLPLEPAEYTDEELTDMREAHEEMLAERRADRDWDEQ